MPLDTFEQDAAANIIVQEDGCVASPMAIPVYIDGPVETRELGSRYGVLRSFTAAQNKAGAGAVKICGHDPRRRVIRISAFDVNGACLALAIAGSNNEATGAFPYQLPMSKVGTTTASGILTLTGIGELWVLGDTNGGCVVSVASESWI